MYSNDTKRFVHMLVFLRKIANLNGFSDFHAAAVRRQFPGQKLEERRLPGAVFADDTDAVAAQHGISKIRNHRHTVKGLRNMCKFDDLFPKREETDFISSDVLLTTSLLSSS